LGCAGACLWGDPARACMCVYSSQHVFRRVDSMCPLLCSALGCASAGSGCVGARLWGGPARVCMCVSHQHVSMWVNSLCPLFFSALGCASAGLGCVGARLWGGPSASVHVCALSPACVYACGQHVPPGGQCPGLCFGRLGVRWCSPLGRSSASMHVCVYSSQHVSMRVDSMCPLVA
jgi:hypothetical protein